VLHVTVAREGGYHDLVRLWLGHSLSPPRGVRDPARAVPQWVGGSGCPAWACQCARSLCRERLGTMVQGATGPTVWRHTI
jgi:hypothetical protein